MEWTVYVPSTEEFDEKKLDRMLNYEQIHVLFTV